MRRKNITQRIPPENCLDSLLRSDEARSKIRKIFSMASKAFRAPSPPSLSPLIASPTRLPLFRERRRLRFTLINNSVGSWCIAFVTLFLPDTWHTRDHADRQIINTACTVHLCLLPGSNIKAQKHQWNTCNINGSLNCTLTAPREECDF